MNPYFYSLMAKKGLGSSVSTPGSSGRNDSNCKFYLKFENNFNDSAVGSTDSDSPTNYGVTFSSTYKKEGNYSGNFDGSSYLSFPNHSDYRLGSTFCIEFWVRPTPSPSTQVPISIYRHSTGNREYAIRFVSGKINFLYSYDGSSYDLPETGNILVKDIWQHIAVTCDGNYLRIFHDGIKELEVSHSGGPYNDGGQPLLIGRYNDLTNYSFYGQLDGLAIHNVARWTESFTI